MKDATKPPHIFITGNTGFIGSWLMKTIPNATGCDSKECDVRDYNSLREHLG